MNSTNQYKHSWRIHGKLYEWINGRAKAANLCTSTYLTQIIYADLIQKGAYQLHPFTWDFINSQGRQRRGEDNSKGRDHQIAAKCTEEFEELLTKTVNQIARKNGYVLSEYVRAGLEKEYARVISRYEKAVVTSCILDDFLPTPKLK